jgi:hypothetical protein
MIFVFLIVLIVTLIMANIFISILIPKKIKQKGFINPVINQQQLQTTNNHPIEIIEETTKKEENYLINGSINALSQKMNLINTRLLTLENAVSSLAREKLDADLKQRTNLTLTPLENKKLKAISDFKEDTKIRIDFIEKELEKIKGKPLITQKKLETFDEKTEQKIRALVYNTKSK